MGQLNTKLELRRAALIENLTSGALVKLLGYLNSNDSIEAVRDCLASNWRQRGRTAVKENILIPCTAATPGQGKTEICLQITERSADILNDIGEGIETMVSIPISFNQFTTFSDFDRQQPMQRSITWRILHAFGNDSEICKNYSGSLEQLLDNIRRVNCPPQKPKRSVGILILVDEILKVRDGDEGFFKRLMDFLADLQQLDLSRNIPTFILITSLELIPVSSHIVSKSGRRLKTIPMPFLADVDLEVVADKLCRHLECVLCVGRNEQEILKLTRFGNLQLLIRVAVSISGRHFRTLEDAAKAIYRRLVSKSQHELAFRDSSVSPIFSPEENERRVYDIFARKGAAIDISIKEVFDCVINLIELGSVNREDYSEALQLFLRLMNEPSLLLHEEELYRLEAAKIVFIKFRDPERMSYIVPRVSLPFLFLYPNIDLHPRLTPAPDRSRHVSQRYLHLCEPKRLHQHSESLLFNIGVALSLPFDQLSKSFEEVIPFIELLTVAARRLVIQGRMEISTVIPDVLFQPWDRESLFIAPYVLSTDITVNMSVEASTPLEVTINAVKAALDSTCSVIYLQQGNLNNMQSIEHVSRLFAAGDQPVLGLCSMKLRAKSNPVQLSNQLHQFASSKIIDQEGNPLLQRRSYYAVIYCCAPKATIDLAAIPPGTIIFPYEAISALLYPVGLNKLLLLAEEKFKDSQS